ncbi:MAG: hypothetical protein KME42_13775 [Tildeniella nuda ZEHNDER 1965/U140]|jgi:hypothetical protein|nr:hypothetical protein [Tildeniella nuda ZEHNDER 1965/U140]
MSEAGDDLFWDSQGLRRIAELIKSQTGPQAGKRMTQERLCYLAGVGKSNLSLFLKNIGNSKGFYSHIPAPEFLLKIAPHIIDPDTGENFDPAKFLAIAWKLNDRVIVLSQAPQPVALPTHILKLKGAIDAVLEAEQIDLKTLAESMKLHTAGITEPTAWLQSLMTGSTTVDPDSLHCLANRVPLDGIKSNIEVWAKLFDLDLKAIAAQHEQSKQGNGHSKPAKKEAKPKPKA